MMKSTIPVKEEKSTVPTSREHNLFQSLQKEMNKLLEEFKGNLGFAAGAWTEPMSDFHAKVNVKDNDKELIVTADLPGVELKDIDVSVTDSTIVIRGEKKVEKEESDKGYYRMERCYGSFHRILPLPCAIEKGEVNATYKDGVLTVTLPKSKEIQKNQQKIEVKAG